MITKRQLLSVKKLTTIETNHLHNLIGCSLLSEIDPPELNLVEMRLTGTIRGATIGTTATTSVALNTMIEVTHIVTTITAELGKLKSALTTNQPTKSHRIEAETTRMMAEAGAESARYRAEKEIMS